MLKLNKQRHAPSIPSRIGSALMMNPRTFGKYMVDVSPSPSVMVWNMGAVNWKNILKRDFNILLLFLKKNNKIASHLEGRLRLRWPWFDIVITNGKQGLSPDAQINKAILFSQKEPQNCTLTKGCCKHRRKTLNEKRKRKQKWCFKFPKNWLLLVLFTI